MYTVPYCLHGRCYSIDGDIYLKIHSYVYQFFKNPEKTKQWFETDNILLGGISPIEMIMNGRGERLLEFTINQIIAESSPTHNPQSTETLKKMASRKSEIEE